MNGKKINNAELGITLQKMICDKYNIKPHTNAVAQFDASYNKEYEQILEPIIKDVFNKLKQKPIECLTYAPSKKPNETYSPHNFILSDNSTLSIRTNISGDKVAPRVVGQCGLDRFNEHFSELTGKTVKNKNDIKPVIINNIVKMLPVFIDYMFISDYTVWIGINKDEISCELIESSKTVEIDLNSYNFSFTRGIGNWNESTTLKYKNKSLAEIQIHTNRTFKFGFVMGTLLSLLREQKITSETLGITAEKTICDMFGLKYPDNFNTRYSPELQRQLNPVVGDAFNYLPKPIKHTGSDKGERGGESKCSYDFLLEGREELSLKTNTGKMVCPPEVGQPGASTCYLYFKDYIDEEYVDKDIFKKMVFEHITEIFPIYIEHLYDSDYLLWIYKRSNDFNYRIFEGNYAEGIVWEKDKFSFTKESANDWQESNTLKYDGISIGEFQVHRTRDCYKFRFNLENFSNLVEKLKDR